MARNGKEYQYDCFRSHLHKIPHIQGSDQGIFNRIYKNCMTYFFNAFKKLKYFDGFFTLTKPDFRFFIKLLYPWYFFKPVYGSLKRAVIQTNTVCILRVCNTAVQHCVVSAHLSDFLGLMK